NTMIDNRKINPYFVSNISAGYKIHLQRSGEILLRLSVNNVFNAVYENNAYGGMWAEDSIEKTWAYFFPQAGINYMAGISLSF
ncbi:MAG: TonB-dependent receptor, partial [Bacteroidales bacterium]